jgi:hypothetical protein
LMQSTSAPGRAAFDSWIVTIVVYLLTLNIGLMAGSAAPRSSSVAGDRTGALSESAKVYANRR